MALDAGEISLKDKFDARFPIRIAGHTINDFHAKKRWLTVPEVFIYSSNIGTAKMAETVGVEGHKAFLYKLGFSAICAQELPEGASPKEPDRWGKITSVTASYGHGIPLNTFANGGCGCGTCIGVS